MGDRIFTQIFEDFFSGWLKRNPSTASWLGFHEYDGQVEDLSPVSIERELQRLKRSQGRLQQLQPSTLSPAARFDYHELLWEIESEIFDLEELRDWERNPIVYAQLFGISNYIKRNYAPLDERVRAIIRKFSHFHKIIETAKTNIKNPSRYHVETAIQIAAGQIKFFETDLQTALQELRDEALLKEFDSAKTEAIAQIRAFIVWLKSDLLSQAKGDFALGEAKFKKMLSVKELISLPLAELEKMGERELARLEAESQELLEAYSQRSQLRAAKHELLEKIRQELEAERPTEQTLFSETAKILSEQRAFLEQKGIVTIPSKETCQVTETPTFYRHMAFAAMDPPGMFEQQATEAYYYVTPPEPDWEAQRKEEWLKFFNYPTLKMISIHEAYPGHYVHFLHYRHVSSQVRKAFGSYSFVEGWAHYTEQMMLEEGYGAGDWKLKLAQIDEALIRACRYRVAIGLHTQSWTVEQATQFFMERAHMVRATAEKEALRGTFDPGYLNYTLGKLLVLDLKRAYQAKLGRRFVLRDFHDRLLSYGAPPIKLVREEMLR